MNMRSRAGRAYAAGTTHERKLCGTYMNMLRADTPTVRVIGVLDAREVGSSICVMDMYLLMYFNVREVLSELGDG